MAIQGVEPLNPALVKTYTHDLLALLNETDIIKSKGFLRSFINRIVIEGSLGTIYYKLPVPFKWKEHDKFSVLPIVSIGGAGGLISRTLPAVLTALYINI